MLGQTVIMFYPLGMQPIAVPQSAKDHYQPQGAREVAFHAPPGHEHDTATAGSLIIEGLPDQAYGVQVSLPVMPSDEERADIAAGKPVWLTLCGANVIPFNISVGDVPPVI